MIELVLQYMKLDILALRHYQGFEPEEALSISSKSLKIGQGNGDSDCFASRSLPADE